MTLKYARENGSYYLYQEDDNGNRDIVLMSDEIAVLIDLEDGCLYKHGTPEKVRAYHANLLSQVGDLCARHVIVSSRDWDPDTLNRMLDTSGYAGRWYAAQQAGQDGALLSAR